MTKRILVHLFFAFCIVVTSVGAIEPTPDITLLWNRFIDVKSFNGYAIGLTDVGAAVLEYDTLQDLFVQDNQIFLSSPAKSCKLEGYILVVRHFDDHLSYVDLNHLPEISLRGESFPDVDYADFAMRGSELYLSHWFGGISKYGVDGTGELGLLVTDTTGVLITQLETDETSLYALDMYNGLLHYDLTGPFGNSIEKLKVSRRPFAFAQVDSLFVISLSSFGTLIGEFNGPNGRILDSIMDVPSPQKVLHTDDRIILLSQRQAHVFSLPDYELLTDFSIGSLRITGDIVNIEDTNMLLLPFEESGLTVFDIEGSHPNRPVLSHAGPISSIVLDRDRLFTGGKRNPLEVYTFDSNGITDVQVIKDSNGVADLAKSSNRLFALYLTYNSFFVFDISDQAEIPQASWRFWLLTGGESEIHLSNEGIDAYPNVFISGRDFIDTYTWFAQGYRHSGHWGFFDPITSFSLIDTTLYVADRFGKLSGYSGFPRIDLTKCAEQDLVGTAWKTLNYDNRVFAFVGNTLTIVSSCVEVDTIIYLPLPVLDAQITNDALYTVGTGGVAVYDLASGFPMLIEQGGLGGSQITVDNGTVATTDGSAVHLYFMDNQIDSAAIAVPAKESSMVLFDNYPDPFNSTTIVQYQLLTPAEVDLSIYNLLGQKVTTLVSAYLPAGSYQVAWDGHDQQSNEVSSGIYFYRLQTPYGNVSKKMMLLK